MTPPKRPPLKDFGPIQAPGRLGIAVWQFEAARRRGLIPPPDSGGRWSVAVIEEAEQRLQEIRAAVGEQAPVGAQRGAARIGERLGLELDRAEIDALADRGLLAAVDEYKGWPLYDVQDLDAVADRERDIIAALAAERVDWLARSVPRREALARLGWSRDEFERAAAERGVQAGRFGRYATADLDVLAADEELADQVRGSRLLGPDQAAEHLEVRRTDFDYCVAAGWLSPAAWVESRISRNRTVDVALYRVADVEAVRDVPGVDWEAVRAVKPGEPSPLREFASIATKRSVLVRGFAADLTARHGVEVAARYDGRRDRWELSWALDRDGEPSVAAVRAELAADRDLKPHAAHMVLRADAPADSSETAG